MKRALLTFVVWLALVPSARADWISFDAMAGSVSHVGRGSGSGDLFLLRDDFWVHTGGQAGGCRGVVVLGRPIAPCGGGNSLTPFIYFMGGTFEKGWLAVDVIAQPRLASDSHVSLTGASVFFSGPTRPVLTEPLPSCPQPGCAAIQPSYRFAIDGLYSVEVPLEEQDAEEDARTAEFLMGHEFETDDELEAGDELDTTRRTRTFARQTIPPGALVSLAVAGLVGLLVCGRYLKPR